MVGHPGDRAARVGAAGVDDFRVGGCVPDHGGTRRDARRCASDLVSSGTARSRLDGSCVHPAADTLGAGDLALLRGDASASLAGARGALGLPTEALIQFRTIWRSPRAAVQLRLCAPVTLRRSARPRRSPTHCSSCSAAPSDASQSPPSAGASRHPDRRPVRQSPCGHRASTPRDWARSSCRCARRT